MALGDVIAFGGLVGGVAGTYHLHSQRGGWFWPIMGGLGILGFAGIIRGLLEGLDGGSSSMAGIVTHLTSAPKKTRALGSGLYRRPTIPAYRRIPAYRPQAQNYDFTTGQLGCLTCF